MSCTVCSVNIVFKRKGKEENQTLTHIFVLRVRKGMHAVLVLC